MDASKKSVKTKFLAPGMLGKSQKKAKVSFGLPGYLCTVGNKRSPDTNVSNMTSPAASLSQNQKDINTGSQCILSSKSTSITGMGQSPFVAPVVTTKPNVFYQDLEDLCAAGYKLSDLIGSVPLRPELGKTANLSFENVLPYISEENSTARPFVRQGEASKGEAGKREEEESIHASENTSNHPIDTDIPIITIRKRVIADASKWEEEESVHASENTSNHPIDTDAMKDLPNHLIQEDWEWLVKEHYMSDDFKKLSERNSKNRGTQNMMPRRPIQDVIWRA